MRSRMLQLGLAAAAVLALAVTLGVYRGVIDVLLMVGIAAAVAGMYLLRRYARTVLVYNRHVESPAPIRCLERKKAVVLPTILEPPCDQWASQELNDTSLLGSDFLPMIARCRQTCHVDLGRRFCWRFVPAARSRGSRSPPQVRPIREIARTVLLSPGTIRNYLAAITQKLDAGSRAKAYRIARDHGWI